MEFENSSVNFKIQEDGPGVWNSIGSPQILKSTERIIFKFYVL